MDEEGKYLLSEIKNQLQANLDPCYNNTLETWIYTRCPFCGDSTHDKRAAHFYIRMCPPFVCYCQKCTKKTYLNNDVLEKLGIYNNDLVLNINKANKLSNYNSKLLLMDDEKKVSKYEDKSDNITNKSLEYFNSRFGTNCTIDELNKTFKCVLNPTEYFKIKSPLSKNARFDYSKSIGFLSTDNSYLICRDTSGTQELRYSNSSLIKDGSKSYNIRTQVDLLQDKIKLVITEGIFDSIGIFFKKFKNSKNVIIAAACGKSYAQVITKFIKMGFLNLDIEIYSDSDVDINFYKDMKKKLYFLKDIPLTIYYNELNKDCGVSADNIKLRKVII